jgi:diadenosine tetraphosphate (Ap4A) HIT family hydrolase
MMTGPACLALVDQVKRGLEKRMHPDGFAVGFHAGTAAGQTAGHLRVRVIPPIRATCPTRGADCGT